MRRLLRVSRYFGNADPSMQQMPERFGTHRVPWSEPKLSKVVDLGPLDVIRVVSQETAHNGSVGWPCGPEPGANDGMIAGVRGAIVGQVAGQVAHHVDICCRGEVAAKLCHRNREDPASRNASLCSFEVASTPWNLCSAKCPCCLDGRVKASKPVQSSSTEQMSEQVDKQKGYG